MTTPRSEATRSGAALRGLRPETHALDALIRATVRRARQNSGRAPTDTMLFMGNGHHSVPALVVQDPVLEPVDKLVWMVILLQARETGGSSAFPSYETLAKKTNVSSTSTIARAIAILRATRWLTLCAPLREANGRYSGNVYALHDEPLPLADALHLDHDYTTFLRQSLTHHHARVRRVAQGLLDTLDEDIHAGLDICAVGHPLERRLRAAAALQQDTPRRYFAFSAKVMTRLRNGMGKDAADHRDQNSKAAAHRLRILYPQKSKAVSSSSIYIYKTTTTTEETAKQKISHDEEAEQSLVYPERLSANQRDLADRYLTLVPVNERQALLDELEGRLRSEHKGMKPVYDPLRFLHFLCRAATQGDFVANLGIEVCDERKERAKASVQDATRPSATRAQAKTSAVRKPSTAVQSSLAEMRQSLGVPSPEQNDDATR